MRTDYRNDKYLKLKESQNYKTIAAIKNNVDVITYLVNFEKKIDYICTIDNVSIPEEYSGVDTLKIDDIKELPTTYVIVTNDKEFKKNNRLENTCYYYENNMLTKMENVESSIEDNYLKYTNRVSFELSNICNLSKCHYKCPLSKCKKEKQVLPLKIIKKVLAELKENNYEGMISFHTYNEPLIDPRLFYIVSLVKEYLPKSELYLLTNGFYLTQDIANELVEIGIDRLDTTAYSNEDYDRAVNIKVNIPYSVFYTPKVECLDDRLELYDEESSKDNKIKPCYNPLNELTITFDGKIDLCCFDWKREHVYGDLSNQTLKEVILHTELYNVFMELVKGKRNFTLCKNCLKATTKSILDFKSSGIYYKKNDKK